MDNFAINTFIEKTKELYRKDQVTLHEPIFIGNEKSYLNNVIDSSFVSYKGEYVDAFEREIANFVGTKYAVSTVNGTSALHAALIANNVKFGDEVITQPLTFVATANAIAYCAADPIFLDVDEDTMGLSPYSLVRFLENNTTAKNGHIINKMTGKKISAVVPMHTFGMPARIKEICEIASSYGLPVVEDAAEALGSGSNGKFMGSFGICGVFSFNANKIITSGGGGMIVTDDEHIYDRLMHLTKTSKIPHRYEFIHDEIGYNYRLPNVNACIGLAQFEQIHHILRIKQHLAEYWSDFFEAEGLSTRKGHPKDTLNNWLIAIEMKSKLQRDHFLEETNNAGIGARPIWQLMSDLPMFSNSITDSLQNARHLVNTVINIPSGVPSHFLAN